MEPNGRTAFAQVGLFIVFLTIAMWVGYHRGYRQGQLDTVAEIAALMDRR